MTDIPKLREHSNCKNCGWCCCIVPITGREDLDIRRYLEVMDSCSYQDLVNQPRGHGECQFHDRDKRRCAIYSVRPKVCRMFGSVLGMNCPHGNSSNLNVRHLLTQQPTRLMPEYIDRKISPNYSVPLATLSNAEDYFRKACCILANAEVEYKFRNHKNVFQISVDIDNKE